MRNGKLLSDSLPKKVTLSLHVRKNFKDGTWNSNAQKTCIYYNSTRPASDVDIFNSFAKQFFEYSISYFSPSFFKMTKNIEPFIPLLSNWWFWPLTMYLFLSGNIKIATVTRKKPGDFIFIRNFLKWWRRAQHKLFFLPKVSITNFFFYFRKFLNPFSLSYFLYISLFCE